MKSSGVNKLVPKDKVGIAFGLVNAGQSLGQLVIAPLAGFVIVSFGWIASVYMLCLMLLLVLPLSLILLQFGLNFRAIHDRHARYEDSNDEVFVGPE